ncbi:hypothetical protein WICPIJ_002759 [Wickerhamomyces pijperi]|uniref:Valine--tRNA ligase, mitochondrial n=2 Tax=Saccharomycotina TaxID=147537 RepID=A0A9P8QB21_WICPI|nr:hypothetical protein WICPIJ_002759 [Wickerhamomyces pijperi]
MKLSLPSLRIGASFLSSSFVKFRATPAEFNHRISLISAQFHTNGFQRSNPLKMSEQPQTPAAAASAPETPAAAPVPAVEGAPKVKTEKELEKERKKAEKLAKFEAKKKKAAESAAKTSGAPAKPKKEKKVAEPVPEFIDATVKGEKKILVSLDDPALKAYDPKNVESSWYDWWVAQGYFEPEFTEAGEFKPEGVFCIPAPPPNVTGALHIGHALTVSIQDTLIRYYRMKGKTVLYLPGFDHAGIATQAVVEKQLAKQGISRHDLGREEFVKRVWDWKEIYHAKIKNQFTKLGASYDWTRERFTLDEDLSKAVTEAFVRLHRDGTIYRAARLVNWSVKMNTALSNLEVDNKDVKGKTLLSVPGYDEKIEFGVITSFAYPIEDSDEKIVVATTRPETLFGDTGIAVHPEDPRYKHLHGKFALHPFLDRKVPIITDSEAVDMEFGTGAVKITPAHDNNDYLTGKRNNLEFINILTDDGKLNENAGEWAGMKRFDARQKVIDALKEKGLFVEQKDNEMTIPICSRSGDVIEPILKPQWWVSQKDMAKEAIAAVRNGDIAITPKSSEAEYFHWLENIQDWCISRQLWWGHRCPVYFVQIEGEQNDENDDHYWVSGRTLEEAEVEAKKRFPDAKYSLRQDEDVLDTWFSSGLWPMSTLGWPETTKDLKDFYPWSMLETGWDILFFWVSRMILLGLKLHGEVPFKEVFCHSLVRDAQGRKMSKSLGNVIDPTDVIKGISLEALHATLNGGNLAAAEIEKAKAGQKESYPNGIPQCGTDALRFALCAYTTGGRDINLDILRVEGYRKFCNKIYQATKFALLRLGDDYQPPAKEGLSGNEALVEKWILHKYTETAKTVNEGFEKREFFNTTSAIYEYWYQVCDVYIENSKSLILEGTEAEAKSARDTLYTSIEGALRLISPFMPFLSEELWQRLPKRASETSPSIVKARFPEFNSEFSNAKAHEDYETVLAITEKARSLLAQYNIIKNGKVFVEITNADEQFQSVNTQKDSIVALIKAIDSIEVVNASTDIPSGCVLTAVTPEINVHVLVKGQVDIDAEIAKVQKKLGGLLKNKQNLEKMVNAKDYAIKASKEAQEQNQVRFDNFVAEIEGFEATIKNLESLKL